ncbi:SDR family NAD(P)-dependent oxidoreductase [Hwanghaeella grinnelliae]|uniref:SDR family NAD(P)-dependent oxidoreductase n=1 Tax=Hwanghaeella grinnelliae TaxID=2500179 RepID=A0A3S2Y0A5_9PROT|nr:type I polyketide synthase [Hwanghaeella grinnelliae]RVU33970.1 SDR family NAD(P)-dependent oxidoreductase [Hwanghaeella grinnelliae]
MTEEIAVISMSCRFPGGADSPEAFWENMLSGVDAISRVPEERFNIDRFYDANVRKNGESYTDKGGFIDWDPAQFDPIPFKISPREAAYMDPQQRLLLEECANLFRRAGYSQEKVAGSTMGVFVGGFCVDNLLLRLSPFNRDNIQAHTATGSALTMLANRVSHVFDLHGPSFAVDTACSSSLVALHQAVQSLQCGDCPIAIVAGVNVIMAPEYFLVMSKGRFLSPNGRCASFDAEADGYARGEGCGAIMLKPLQAALRDGDTVLATVAGSGVNQDGRTRGITVPSRDSQTDLMRTVLKKSAVASREISYVEAHGTGTQAGDVAEAGALQSVLGDSRSNEDDPVLVGSVKSQIGHLEAAAGIAGVIKAILVLQHREIPANLHLNTPNPNLPWDNRCKVVVDRQPLPEGEAPATVLVNSFGYGGTNAMALLRQHGVSAVPSKPIASDVPIPLAAWSVQGLQNSAAALLKDLSDGPYALRDVLATNAATVVQAPIRALLWAREVGELSEKLSELMTDDLGYREPTRQPLCFVYSGNGPHWWGMGKELYESEPVYRDILNRIDRTFQDQAGFSFLEAMGTSGNQDRIGRTDINQPAGFALQVALTGLLRHRGIRPDAVLGHSLGEVAAFHAAGLLSLEDAVKVVHHRSRLQASLAGRGAMLATALDQAGAEALLSEYPDVDIAAVNSDSLVTFSGAEAELDKVAHSLGERNIFHRYLPVDIAFHSRQMAEIERELSDCLANVQFLQPEIPLFSTVTGAGFNGAIAPDDYWRMNIRQPVLFRDGMAAMLGHIGGDVVEVGPHPVLAGPIQDIVFNTQSTTSVTHTLEREVGEGERLQSLIGTLYKNGQDPDWSSWYTGSKVVPLTKPVPTHAHRWVESNLSRQYRHGTGASPFTGQRIDTPGAVWNTALTERLFPWMNDHVFRGSAAFPASGYVAAFLSCLKEAQAADQPVGLKNITFHSLWLLNGRDNFQLFTQFEAETGKLAVFGGVRSEQYSQVLQASGWLSSNPPTPVNWPAHRERFSIDRESFYGAALQRGLAYGQSFRVLDDISVGENTVQAELRFEEADAWDLFPPLLDGAFHATLAVLTEGRAAADTFVPIRIGTLLSLKPATDFARVHIAIRDRNARKVVVDLRIVDRDGEDCLLLRDVEYSMIPATHETRVDAFVETWDALDEGSAARFADAAVEDIRMVSAGWLEDRTAFETLLFDVLIPAMTSTPDKRLRLVVETEGKDPGALANMCMGLVRVADREYAGDRLSVVFGLRTALERFESVWRSTKSPILKVADEGCFAPTLRILPDEPPRSVPPIGKQQVYFDWPLGSAPPVAGGLDCESDWEMTAATKCALLGWHLAQVQRHGECRLALVRKPDRRFISVDDTPTLSLPEHDAFAQTCMALFSQVVAAMLPKSGAVMVIGNHPMLDAVLRTLALTATDTPNSGDTVLRLSGALPDNLPEGLLIVDLGDDPLMADGIPIWRPDLAARVKQAIDAYAAAPAGGKEPLSESLWTRIATDDLAVPPVFSFRGETVLVAGGSGGFGLAFAKWALLKGAGRVVVLSRSGKFADEAGAIPKKMEIHKVDICIEAEVKAFFEQQKTHELPIRHVFHSAAVLNDQTIAELDRHGYETVMAPKTDGAALLDKYSRDLGLKRFVVFSSVTSALGNSGQVAYAVANRMLEDLVQQRNACGLPGLAVQWGPIEDVGLLARDRKLVRLLAKQGMGTISSAEAFARLEHDLLLDRKGVVAVYRAMEAKADPDDYRSEGKWRDLEGLSYQGRVDALRTISVSILSEVLKRPPDDFPVDTPLSELGIDSLLALEALLEHERVLGIRVPMPLFLGHLSVIEVCKQVARLEPSTD